MKKSSSSYYFVCCLCIFAALSAFTAVSGLVLSSSPSHAETSSVLASVTVPDVCTIAADNSSTAHTDTVGVGEYKANIGETVFNITCNDNNGYSIYAVGYSNNTVGNTNLIGTTNGATIPTGTSTVTGSNAVSNWAMKLTAVSGTFPATILDSYDSYHVVPSTATKVATRTSSIDLSEDSQIKTTYAVSISPAQTADSYVGKVKYTVVHPNYANADGSTIYPVTLSFGVNTTSITIDGVTYTSLDSIPNLAYGTHTISGAYPSGYEFSSWSSTGNITIADSASASTTINVTGAGSITLASKVQLIDYCTQNGIADANCLQKMAASDCTTTAKTVTDSRDGKTYRVQKLADNKCWMLDNLALDLVDKKNNLSAFNTNASDTALGYLKSGGGSSPYTNYAVATATSTDYYDRPAIATSGTCNNAYCVDNPSSGNWKWDAVTSATINGKTSKAQGQIGVYYNYCAASAGSYCYTSSAGPSSDPDTSTLQDVKEDICPKGWRLPTSTSSGEFQALYTAYSSNYTNFQTALSTPLSGTFYSGKAYYQGNSGFFWSSTWFDGSIVDVLFVGSTAVYPGGNGAHRSYSLSIRCVFGS